jgi:hypothetical protein
MMVDSLDNRSAVTTPGTLRLPTDPASVAKCADARCLYPGAVTIEMRAFARICAHAYTQ